MSALLLLAALIGAWQLYTVISGVDPTLVPPPSDVASSLWNDRGLLWSNLGTTAAEIVLGLALALVVATLVAVLVHLWPAARRAVMPLVAASQAVPFVVFAPLLVFWFGFNVFPKALVIAVVTFFPITVTLVDGLMSVDPALGKLLQTFGASRWRALRMVDAPAAFPSALSGAIGARPSTSWRSRVGQAGLAWP